MNKISVRALSCILLTAGFPALSLADSASLEALRQRLGKEHRLSKMLVSGEAVPLPERPVITLQFVSETVLGGVSGVNRYFGGYFLDDEGRIRWDQPGIATTRMAGPEDLMALEYSFLAALQMTERLAFQGREVVLSKEDGSVQLVFAEVVPESAMDAIYGKTLTLSRFIWQGTELELPGNPKLTMILTADARVSGKSAVNSYMGSFKLLPDEGIEFGRNLASTMMAGPPELMKLEDSYYSALAAVQRVNVSANSVRFTNDSKTVVLEFAISLSH